MTMFVPTCDNCGGQKIEPLERRLSEMAVHRVGNRVMVKMPLPMLCLDCGSTAYRFKSRRT